MKKKNEKAAGLVDEINKALGDKSKSSEIFYLLKKQGEISTKQKDEIIKLGKDLLESQRTLKGYLNKYIDVLSFLKQRGDVSHLQQADIIELEKRMLESHKAAKEILIKLVDTAKTLKIVLPKSFDVKVLNSKDFPTEFKISNLDELPKLPDEIHIKEPLWLPVFFESIFNFVTQPVIKAIKKQLQEVNISGPTDPKKAIAVRLSDGKRFYTAVLQAISAASSNSQKIEDLLQQIANNTDTLELKADQVNLNTDTLEALLAQFQFNGSRLKVDANIVIPSDPTNDVNRSTRASEATLVQVRDYLDTVETKFQTLIDQTDTVEANLQSTNTKLDTLHTDVDTVEAKLQSIADNTDTLESKLQTIIDGNLWQRNVKAGKAYVVTTNAVIVAGTSEVAFLLLKNPNASGKTIRIDKILLGLENIASISTCRIYRDPTITTNGTALTPVNLLKGGAASIMTAFRSPAISANGTLMITDPVSGVSDHDQDLGLLISPNENMLLTLDPTTTNIPHMITVYYMEE